MSEWMQSFRLIEAGNNQGINYMNKRPNTVAVSSLMAKPNEFMTEKKDRNGQNTMNERVKTEHITHLNT